jgi:hypothetical protein
MAPDHARWAACPQARSRLRSSTSFAPCSASPRSWRAHGRPRATHADDINEADARAALQQLDPLWDELFPAEQARIVALLVERVDIGTEGLNVRLRVDGLGGFACEMLAGNMGEAA